MWTSPIHPDRGMFGSLFDIRGNAENGEIAKTLLKVALCFTLVIPLIAVIAWAIAAGARVYKSSEDAAPEDAAPEDAAPVSYEEALADCDFNKKKGQNLFKQELSLCDLDTREGRILFVEIMEKTFDKIGTDLKQADSLNQRDKKIEQYSVIRKSLLGVVNSKLKAPFLPGKTILVASALERIFNEQVGLKDFAQAKRTLKLMQSKLKAMPSQERGETMSSMLKQTCHTLQILKDTIEESKEWSSCIKLLRQLSHQAYNISNTLNDDDEAKRKLNEDITHYDEILESLVTEFKSHNTKV